MKVALIMGSLSDEKIAEKAVNVLKEFDINYDIKILSAHRSLKSLEDYCEENKDEVNVYIALAGKAAHLAGVIAGMNIQPVIAVPIGTSGLMGMDALLSTVQMPSGVPVATVAINAADNAALLAIQILALQNNDLKKKLLKHKDLMHEKVLLSEKELKIQ
ncbi:MAG: 5-(carboxyamino)imidazole ribonucleotide mutase [Erysipelothrix sp.]|nr:5-(carboxyamino)imidazole ribonucleotide mutase [Erysipelothrix sp.]